MLDLLQKIVDKIKIQNRWFNLYNTILWTGEAAIGTTITVPNIQEYDVFLIDLYNIEHIAPIICVRHGEYIIGGQMTEGVSADNIAFSFIVSLQVQSGNKIVVRKSRIMAHSPSSGHNAGSDIPIRKITGLAPRKEG